MVTDDRVVFNCALAVRLASLIGLLFLCLITTNDAL